MRYFSAMLIAASLFFSFPVGATEIIQLNETWFSCKNSQSCVWTSAPCGGPEAVNKEYKEQYERYSLNQSTMIRCVVVSPSYVRESKNHAVCKERTCVIDMPEWRRWR